MYQQGYGQPQDWEALAFYPIGQSVAHNGSIWRSTRSQNKNSEPTNINPDWDLVVQGGGGTLTGGGTAGIIAVWTGATALGDSATCLTADPVISAGEQILFWRQIGGTGPRELAVRFGTGAVQVIAVE